MLERPAALETSRIFNSYSHVKATPTLKTNKPNRTKDYHCQTRASMIRDLTSEIRFAGLESVVVVIVSVIRVFACVALYWCT